MHLCTRVGKKKDPGEYSKAHVYEKKIQVNIGKCTRICVCEKKIQVNIAFVCVKRKKEKKRRINIAKCIQYQGNDNNFFSRKQMNFLLARVAKLVAHAIFLK